MNFNDFIAMLTLVRRVLHLGITIHVQNSYGMTSKQTIELVIRG